MGSEEGGGVDRGTPGPDCSPLKEVPQSISLVQLPAVGKIRGKEARFGMHNSPTQALMELYASLGNVPDLSIEGRVVPDKATQDKLAQNPQYTFQALSRLKIVEVDGKYSGYMMLPKFDANDHLVSEKQALTYVSQSSAPSTLASELGYDLAFFPLARLGGIKSTVGGLESFLIRGCNEFRIGSNSMSQPQLDALATTIGEYLFMDEVKAAKWSSYKNTKPSSNLYRFVALNTSYLPE